MLLNGAFGCWLALADRLGLTVTYARVLFNTGTTEEFARKWKKFSTDGLDKLMVIADFDYTLTPFFKPTRTYTFATLFSILRSLLLCG